MKIRGSVAGVQTRGRSKSGKRKRNWERDRKIIRVLRDDSFVLFSRFYFLFLFFIY